MKILPLIAGLSVASLALSSPQARAASAAEPDGPPQLLTEIISSGTDTPASALSSIIRPGWSFVTHKGGSVGLEETTSPSSAGATVKALKGSYPIAGAGAQFVMANYNIFSLQTEDIYIEFWAKMPGAKGGCKFVKIFGDHPIGTNSFADVTIGTNYTGGDYGSIYQIGFGDGSILANDGQHGIRLDGTSPQGIGRSYGKATVSTPQMRSFSSTDWGTSWHHFRIHVKFNSGTTAQNEVANGEVYLEIDGRVYVDATGLYNRNPANGPIHTIQFFGWAQQDPQAFQLWYDDIRISTGGFSSQTLPDPPVNVGATEAQ
ncbi:MAG TPA: hypothetical protein VGR92_02730 [Steroidobacteraceae bacterium]|nr:hypothetical protein [Steroidobacteraceae bacterium]